MSQVAGVVQLAKAAAPRPGGVPADGALPGSLLEQGGVIMALSDTEQRLEAQVNRNTVYGTLVTCATFVAVLPVLYAVQGQLAPWTLLPEGGGVWMWI